MFFFSGPAEPGTPSSIEMTASSIRIIWNNPTEGAFDGFQVKYSPADGRTPPTEFVEQDSNDFTFIGLTPGVSYNLCVCSYAGNDAATRKFSESVCIDVSTGMYIMDLLEIKECGFCFLYIFYRSRLHA